MIDHILTMLQGRQICSYVSAVAVVTAIGFYVYDYLTKKQEIERLQQQLEDANRTNSELHQEKTALRVKNNELTDRLSKTASEKMRTDNPIVENLNDPHRPTALASKWAGLFRCGEYWTAFENLKSISKEADIPSVLHRVCRLSYETTKAYVQDLMEELKSQLALEDDSATSDSSDNSSAERKDIKHFFPDKDERESFLDSLRDLRTRHQQDDSGHDVMAGRLVEKLLKSKPPPASLIQEVDRVLRQDESLDLSLVKSFTDQLVPLIYRMRAQEIPLMLDFQGSEGMTFDPALYEPSGAAIADARSLVIKSVMRPALLRNEPGPVLSKGEIEVMSRSQWNSLRKKSVETPPSQEEGKVDETSTEPAGPEEVTHYNGTDVRGFDPPNVAPQENEPPADPKHSAEKDDAPLRAQDQLTGEHTPGPNQQGHGVPMNAMSEPSPATQRKESTRETTGPSLQAPTRRPEEDVDPAGPSRDVAANTSSTPDTSNVEIEKESVSAPSEASSRAPDVQPSIPDNDGHAGSDSVSDTADKQAAEASQGRGSGHPVSEGAPSTSDTAGDSGGSLPVAGPDSTSRSTADAGEE